ncbi:TPA: hypothetical protein N3414_000665 [Klebsiella quasipneumoniae subsp. quasipneumoniae]|uniref:hypothetical protein n=1 Tax=Klebsiella/Raoultella group TaxID=2890311 RepID=UPI0010826974|nr:MULTISPECIES: hypothetical protein [Klebsiella/Raoultella group]HBW1841940.1 hypothetical protein [Klebsiella quasipneumoniae subsp. quasipneumoniae]MDV0651567.1 hypothetical protein [Klebsiella quasipneumoniae subsp. similipneumoniae]VGA97169.1 Uncharacterised protein [Klebsiella pneumoniae]HCM7673502.1 hypothetical protein [Klebsiella quasipneumoniae subsp. quasipneumoniae]HEC2594147.1 hypothetical protein [Raoultella planticola]
MKISLLGVGNVPLLSARIKTLDNAGLLNVSALARLLGCARSTFLSKVASVGLEAAILHYSAIKKQRDVLATLSEKDVAAFLAACNANSASNVNSASNTSNNAKH